MKTPLLLISLTALATAADAPAPKAGDIAKGYAKTLTRLTEKPKSIGAEFAGMCRSVPLDKTAGLHSRHYVHYFRDALAQQPGEKFPAGSVLVKEKFGEVRDGGKLELESVAGMIKRPAGTLPKSGDWEFFWAAEGKLLKIDAQSCAGCHSGAKLDYVFTDAPKPAR